MEVLIFLVLFFVLFAIDVCALGTVRERFLAGFDRDEDGWESWHGSRERRIAVLPMGATIMLFLYRPRK